MVETEKNFPAFIIGDAMKCGTTSLYAVLSSIGGTYIFNEELHIFTMEDFIQFEETVRIGPDLTLLWTTPCVRD